MVSFNNYVSYRYIQLNLGNRVAIFLGKSCYFCLPSVHFMVTVLYLSVLPFGVGGLIWNWLYQFLSLLTYFLFEVREARKHWSVRILGHNLAQYIPEVSGSYLKCRYGQANLRLSSFHELKDMFVSFFTWQVWLADLGMVLSLGILFRWSDLESGHCSFDSPLLSERPYSSYTL